jgi:alpha-aminoadipate carrier protein LysW
VVDKAIKQVAVATCPDCGEQVAVRSRIRLGQDVVCPNCDAELEVVGMEPLELDWAYDDEYDDEDEDDEDEDW